MTAGGPETVGSRVVVGVDGSPGSRAALSWALSAAPARCPVLVVHPGRRTATAEG